MRFMGYLCLSVADIMYDEWLRATERSIPSLTVLSVAFSVAFSLPE